uniref:NADH-ubiquinone oxidoreductase chain 4 n=1 Tax=Alveobothrium grabatum TaxID=2810044 RepID=A0A8K1SXA8_9CEST|nr:NADH dehydrogenase subunit 4 [Alveobothrium grabatum]UFQ88714.1 NADH dehydrogenase subunit 4 [Alveobothrium grabatum]UFQ88726.1 NADH dehydrogenase subunit 4 [Alveobothrium grabatum]
MSVFNFFGPSVFLISSFLLVSLLIFSNGVGLNLITNVAVSDIFIFDSLSFYLLTLVFLLGSCCILSMGSSFNVNTKIFLLLSLFFSGVCFCVNHAVLFWCFYELSMLPLLYLIFKDSPYSERFIAGWYFTVYLLVTSLPLILALLYLGSVNGTFSFTGWSEGAAPWGLYIVLCFVFFTKVPLSPFHTWLPIVHAEATSIVSIFLSGYIMKLGLLGVFRCGSFLFSSWFYPYLFFCCVLSIFFIITASTEMDGKRWLAFLSLSHIVVAFLAFFSCSWETVSLSFIFCLGHGLSAGLVFGLLWLFYDTTNSRNWLLLKDGVSGNAILLSCLLALLSLCSFPPTLQFFCEVNLLMESVYSAHLVVFWCFYLFFGGLIPLVLCGHSIIRTEAVETVGYSSVSFFMMFFYLGIWCYLSVFIL